MGVDWTDRLRRFAGQTHNEQQHDSRSHMSSDEDEKIPLLRDFREGSETRETQTFAVRGSRGILRKGAARNV